jgi:hypothetical protein
MTYGKRTAAAGTDHEVGPASENDRERNGAP